MKECCETGVPKKRYWHWVALGGVVLLAGGLQVIPETHFSHGTSAPVKAMTDIEAILQSLSEYSIDNEGRYPESLLPLVTPDTNGHCYLEGYDMKIPKDPWKREYLYDPPTPEHPKPRVRSLGSDGKPGGRGTAEDIDSDRLRENVR